ncbi:MAG: cytochrome P450 [Isosphaeraceae bacterium]
MISTRRQRSRTSLPPGPPGHWLTGHLRHFGADRLGFLERCAKEYGDIVGFRLGPRPIILVNHPDLVEDVLVTKNRCFIKHFALRMTQLTLGNGLLTSEGDFWRRQRRLAQPAFHRTRIAGYGADMVDLTLRMLDHWEDGQIRDVQDDMMRLTLEIVAKTLFGSDIANETAQASAAMETLQQCFAARIGKLIRLPERFPTPVNLRLRFAARRLDRVLQGMVNARRARSEPGDDLLSMLLEARDEDGQRMTDLQLRDEAMTLFMAGHETTANTLAWVFYLLSLNPETDRRMSEELGQVLGGRPPIASDVERLPYTQAIVSEALRLYPTVWILGREAIEPCQVGPCEVPQGTTVYMCQWLLHRDERYFADPLSYRPERWLDPAIEALPRYAYFPFGGGPRICIGNGFALMEATLLLATIAQRYRLDLTADSHVQPLATLTLRPAHGVKVIVKSRD